MPRHPLRVISVLLLLAAAILVPFVASGYSELNKVSRAGSYVEMARDYQAAALRLPWHAGLFELAGHAYYHAKEYTQAEAAYRNAYERNALSPQGWVAWGDVLYLNNQREQAAQIWEQGLEQASFSESLYSRLSKVYQEKGDYLQAAQVLQKYVSVHQEDASAHYRLGLLLTLTDPDTALSELITASQLDPQLDPAVEALRSALNQASLNDSASDRSVLIGRGLGLVQEWELARVAFDSAVEADKANAEAWAWLGEAKHQTSLDGRAELDQALALNPNSPTVRGLRGLYFQRTGNFPSALTEFQAAAQLDDKNPAWQVSIGETYSKLGDLIRALQAYQAATKLARGDAGYWRMLALFSAQNKVDIETVGISAAKNAILLEKDSADSQDLLGWLFLLDERYTEAEIHLKKALELDPKNAMVHLHLGLLYMQMENHAAAHDHLVIARDLGNTDAEAILKQYFP